MKITVRELAQKLGLNEYSVKFKLCNFQLQKYVIYERGRYPNGIIITEQSLYILEKLLFPELHMRGRAEKLERFNKFIEDYRDEIKRTKKVFNCF